jgi:hypothetical protein
VNIEEGGVIRGKVLVSLKGIEYWLELMTRLVGLKVRGKEINSVVSIFLGKIEVHQADQIPFKHLGLITAVCTLEQPGMFY